MNGTVILRSATLGQSTAQLIDATQHGKLFGRPTKTSAWEGPSRAAFNCGAGTDLFRISTDVRFTPKSGPSAARFACPALCQKRAARICRYAIASSAAARSVGGNVGPSAFAILRVRTNSNLVGCSTEREPTG